MPVEAWFPTLIFWEMLADGAVINAEIEPLLRKLGERQGLHQPQILGPASSGSNAPDVTQYIFLLPALAPLFHLMMDRATAYARELGIDVEREQLYLGRSWVNLLGQGGRIDRHNHARALFSGAYYVSIPDDGTFLRFIDPRSPFRADPHFSEARPGNLTHTDYSPQPGLLLMFPGWLDHGMVVPNRAEGERISISFDIYTVSVNGTSPPPPPPDLSRRFWESLREQARALHAELTPDE